MKVVRIVPTQKMEEDFQERPDHYPIIMKSARLMRQYTVELDARLEDHKLPWIDNNQKKMWFEKYTVVMDALREFVENDDRQSIGT